MEYGSPLDPTHFPGARLGPVPLRLVPQLPTLTDETPAGDGWLHEIKHDGYRMTITVSDGRPRLWTRNGYDWTQRLPTLAAALSDLGLQSAAFDSELVCLDDDNKSDFSRLQSCVFGGPGRPLLYLFDLVHIDGWDLSCAPLIDRKDLLQRLLSARTNRDTSCLRYSEHVQGSGLLIYEHACHAGLEGIVSKRTHSRYRPGKRSEDWLKTKNPAYHRKFEGHWPKRKTA